MIVDAHQHAFWHRRDDAGLIADLDEHGIDKAWLLTWEVPPVEDSTAYHRVFNPIHARPDGTHAGLPLQDALLAARRHPDRFVLGYCPGAARPDAPALFESAWHMHGVRVCGEWKQRMLLDDPRSLELFRKAGELGCPVVVHIDVPYRPDPETGFPAYQWEWYGGTIANFERALDACPDTVFLGHGPGFWREISADADDRPEMYPEGPIQQTGRLVRAMESHANLYADLSAGSGLRALQRDAEFATEFLRTYSARILFARDIYGSELRDFLETLELPQEARDGIYGQNAQRLIGAPTA